MKYVTLPSFSGSVGKRSVINGVLILLPQANEVNIPNPTNKDATLTITAITIL